MTADAPDSEKFHVVVAGAGAAALETVLALNDLASEHVAVTLVAPTAEFVYRPLTVREPFAYAAAARWALAPLVAGAGAELVSDALAWVEPDNSTVSLRSGSRLSYDALVLAVGAKPSRRYKHAVTIDDRHMDDALHGLLQDIEEGYVGSVAFVAPGRMAWPLPLYELALMTAGRAFDMNVELEVTVITPEDAPLAVFGAAVSEGVAGLLAAKGIRTIMSAYAEIPEAGRIVVNPGDRVVRAERAIALPELYGPSVRGLPVSEHGFIEVNRFCRLHHLRNVFAAGDAVTFPVKHGGIGCQQADVVAESIAALAGAAIRPRAFKPELHGILLTDEKPRYIYAKLAGGDGFASEFSETPIGTVTEKIAARYLAPYLERAEREPAGAA